MFCCSVSPSIDKSSLCETWRTRRLTLLPHHIAITLKNLPLFAFFSWWRDLFMENPTDNRVQKHLWHGNTLQSPPYLKKKSKKISNLCLFNALYVTWMLHMNFRRNNPLVVFSYNRYLSCLDDIVIDRKRIESGVFLFNCESVAKSRNRSMDF